MVAFKSTSSASASANAGNKSSLNPSDKVEKQTLTASSSTCAWRIPKATEPQSANISVSYPQRKVPELPGAVNATSTVKEPEKPKSFLERFEEFPNLQKQTPIVTESISTLPPPPPRPPQKLLVGDFNFLEDDDNIDYSQNLFEDDDHFLATLSKPEKPAEIGSSDPLCHVKAKSLLAERSHSAKKKDIWKRTELKETELPKPKIKILKRPEEIVKPSEPVRFESVKPSEPVRSESVKPSEPVRSENGKSPKKAEANLVKKFSTSLKLSTETVSEPQSTPEPPLEKSAEPSKIKIVYSSASKTLQKNLL
jgi:hypothetical protein